MGPSSAARCCLGPSGMAERAWALSLAPRLLAVIPFSQAPCPSAVCQNRRTVSGKTFYIETFGCQMNVHDSEKVIGTLLARGYSQVATPEEAKLVLYNKIGRASCRE